jgi:maleylacetoacetate isomerase
MSDLVLYSYFRSSCSYRVRIGLELKGLPYEYKAVHLLNNGGEQNTPQYKSLNPTAEVPALVHEGRVIGQSMAILLYLDEAFANPSPLFSKDPYQKALMLQFCEGINCAQPLQNLRTLQFLEKSFAFTAHQKDLWLQEWIGRNLQSSEEILCKTAGHFCFGDSPSVADAFLIPQLFTATRFNVSFQKFPTISKVHQNCESLEAFRKAHPFRQPDTPDEMRVAN